MGEWPAKSGRGTRGEGGPACQSQLLHLFAFQEALGQAFVLAKQTVLKLQVEGSEVPQPR